MDNDVVDGRHDELDLLGVGGAGEVGVNLLAVVLVEVKELGFKELTGRLEVIPAWKLAAIKSVCYLKTLGSSWKGVSWAVCLSGCRSY